MSRIKIEIDGTKYDLDDSSADELLEYLGMNSEIQPKKRFQFAQKVIGKTLPAVKTGIKFLANATAQSNSVEHAHEDHRAPHYEDSFERSKEHQLNKEAEYIDRFSEGTDKMYEKMERGEDTHDRFNEFFENHMNDLYAERRALKLVKLRKKKLRKKKALNEQFQ